MELLDIENNLKIGKQEILLDPTATGNKCGSLVTPLLLNDIKFKAPDGTYKSYIQADFPHDANQLTTRQLVGIIQDVNLDMIKDIVKPLIEAIHNGDAYNIDDLFIQHKTNRDIEYDTKYGPDEEGDLMQNPTLVVTNQEG